MLVALRKNRKIIPERDENFKYDDLPAYPPCRAIRNSGPRGSGPFEFFSRPRVGRAPPSGPRPESGQKTRMGTYLVDLQEFGSGRPEQKHVGGRVCVCVCRVCAVGLETNKQTRLIGGTGEGSRGRATDRPTVLLAYRKFRIDACPLRWVARASRRDRVDGNMALCWGAGRTRKEPDSAAGGRSRFPAPTSVPVAGRGSARGATSGSPSRDPVGASPSCTRATAVAPVLPGRPRPKCRDVIAVTASRQ